MFNLLLSSVMGKVTALLGVLFLIVLIGLGYYYVENIKKEKDLANKDTVIGSQKSIIDSQKDTIDYQLKTIDTLQAVKAIDEGARGEVKTNVDILVRKNQTVSQVASKKIAVIEQKYASMPQTSANIIQRDNEISEQRMNALSNVFCNSSMNDPACLRSSAESASASMTKPASAVSN